MRYSKSGLHLTEQFEGCRLVAYQDQKGVWTIGYGHTGPGVFAGQTCTQQQAELWLTQDVLWAAHEVNKLVAVPLTQNEFDALVDFTFNVGAGNFEHSTMRKLLNLGNYKAAAEEFERWDKCGGQIVAGLLRRRTAEKKIFQTV